MDKNIFFLNPWSRFVKEDHKDVHSGVFQAFAAFWEIKDKEMVSFSDF